MSNAKHTPENPYAQNSAKAEAWQRGFDGMDGVGSAANAPASAGCTLMELMSAYRAGARAAIAKARGTD